MKLKLQLNIRFRGRIIVHIIAGLFFILGFYFVARGAENSPLPLFLLGNLALHSKISLKSSQRASSLMRIFPIDKRSRFTYLILSILAFYLFCLGFHFAWLKYFNSLQQEYITIFFLYTIALLILMMLATIPDTKGFVRGVYITVSVLSLIYLAFIFTRELWPMEQYVYGLGFTVILSLIAFPLNYKLFNVRGKFFPLN